jgi:MerR family transcriptional regulator, light-induced transcriptional regulator
VYRDRRVGIDVHAGPTIDAAMNAVPIARPVSQSPPEAPSRQHDPCWQSMKAALESQIIPRLVQSHRAPACNGGAWRTTQFDAAEIETFAQRCALADREGAMRIVAQLRAGGVDHDAIFVDLIGPAARHLGTQWENDRVSFADVTVALIIMHAIVHEMGYAYRDGPQSAGRIKRVMLASAPGSQHVLGLSMVCESFHGAGWEVVLEVSPSADGLCRAAANEWFDLVGLSVALDSQLAGVPALIAGIQAASRNPTPPVILGGPIFTVHGGCAADFGAHGICLDARHAVLLASQLVAD